MFLKEKNCLLNLYKLHYLQPLACARVCDRTKTLLFTTKFILLKIMSRFVQDLLGKLYGLSLS